MNFNDYLTKYGYAEWDPSSYDDFFSICLSLGEVINITDVTVDKNGVGLLVSNDGMGLHTDDPRANFVAWWCKSPAASGGETILADTWKAISTLSQREMHLLRSTLVKVPKTGNSSESMESRPILIGDRDVYFANWLLNRDFQVPSSEINELLDKIRGCYVFRRRLESMESLFINNKRILHGRTSFRNDDSISRELVRVWIQARHDIVR